MFTALSCEVGSALVGLAHLADGCSRSGVPGSTYDDGNGDGPREGVGVPLPFEMAPELEAMVGEAAQPLAVSHKLRWLAAALPQ